MTTRQLHHLYYNAKELKLPLELGIKIPFDSEARTFDEVFHKSGVEKYLVSKQKGRKGILKVELEITLTAIGYNLLKYHNKRYRIVH